MIRGRVSVIIHCTVTSAAAVWNVQTAVAAHLVDVIVHLVSHFFKLVVCQAEVSLVWVEVSILPAASRLSWIHSGGQVEDCLKSLGDRKETCFSIRGERKHHFHHERTFIKSA